MWAKQVPSSGSALFLTDKQELKASSESPQGMEELFCPGHLILLILIGVSECVSVQYKDYEMGNL